MTPDALDTLRDIHLPAPPAPWPVPDWLSAAGVLALVLALLYARRLWRRRALRAAVRELNKLATAHARDGEATRLAGGLSRLLRRHAMARFPQAGVAGLTGTAWLHFLDAHGGNGAFCDGAGSALETIPYRANNEMDAAQVAALLTLARSWLEANP